MPTCQDAADTHLAANVDIVRTVIAGSCLTIWDGKIQNILPKRTPYITNRIQSQ